MHSLQSNAWQTKHTYSKMACWWSYTWQEQIHSMYGSTTISLAKLHIMLTFCQEHFIAKVRARLRHARALHNCKQGHGWIEHNYMSKSSLLKILKTSMDLTVATWIHGIKITAEQRLSEILSPRNQQYHESYMHACASHHIDHKNTWHTPL